MPPTNLPGNFISILPFRPVPLGIATNNRRKLHTFSALLLSTTLAFTWINVHTPVTSGVTFQQRATMHAAMLRRDHILLPFAAALAGVGLLSLMDAFMKERIALYIEGAKRLGLGKK